MSTVSTIINEIVVTGRAERKLIDKAAKLWMRISRWTHASDVEFDDGKTAQEKVGNIDGITSSEEVEKDSIAASSVLVKRIFAYAKKIREDLNNGKINDHIQFVIMSNGKLGWKKDGADTVIPFNNFPTNWKYKGILNDDGKEHSAAHVWMPSGSRCAMFITHGDVIRWSVSPTYSCTMKNNMLCYFESFPNEITYQFMDGIGGGNSPEIWIAQM